MGVAVGPGDVSADHPGLLFVAVVVGAIEGEVGQTPWRSHDLDLTVTHAAGAKQGELQT